MRTVQATFAIGAALSYALPAELDAPGVHAHWLIPTSSRTSAPARKVASASAACTSRVRAKIVVAIRWTSVAGGGGTEAMTVLRARVSAHERLVTLERGEAYFQIAHDPKHPFVVMAGDHRVTDLGTKFLVRRDNKTLEVAVTESADAVTNAALPGAA